MKLDKMEKTQEEENKKIWNTLEELKIKIENGK
jgi:hypothetical protein